MLLTNQTPLPAQVTLLELGVSGERGGVVTAKATFRFEAGRAELEAQSPLPLYPEQMNTPLGLLPSDAFFHLHDERFEVVILGCARAPGGKPVTEMRVAATVGAVRRELMVTGDRTWVQHEGQLSISAPVPFREMPLTWERAFGGRATVEVDEGAFVDLGDPMNPHGRGHDVARDVAALTTFLCPPPGFPKFDAPRLLPNLERPDERIRSPADRPRPACWATLPMDSGLRAAHLLEELPARAGALAASPQEESGIEAVKKSFRSAIAEWVIARPAPESPVVLEGMSEQGTLVFPFPALRVFADYAVGERTGTLELAPHLMVLMVEERRLSIGYQAKFRVPYRPDEERSLRLRLEHGAS